MILIKPSFEILTPLEGLTILQTIERAGRTCYKSENKITDISALDFVRARLHTDHHESIIEHVSLSVKFVCDRGVSHELVRHRLASFSQESTRYCDYSKDKFNGLTFILPLWVSDDQLGEHDAEKIINQYDDIPSFREFSDGEQSDLAFMVSCAQCERNYKKLMKLGWKAQQARDVLITSLKTEIVVTANVREWRTIFKQRTSPAAHPQMRELMEPLLTKLKYLVPVLFDDL